MGIVRPPVLEGLNTRLLLPNLRRQQLMTLLYQDWGVICQARGLQMPACMAHRAGQGAGICAHTGVI